MVITFGKLRKTVKPQRIKEARAGALEAIMEVPLETWLGIRRGHNHPPRKLYLYVKFVDWFKSWPHRMYITDINSFLLDVKDEVRYRPLTFFTLAKHLLTLGEKE